MKISLVIVYVCVCVCVSVFTEVIENEKKKTN